MLEISSDCKELSESGIAHQPKADGVDVKFFARYQAFVMGIALKYGSSGDVQGTPEKRNYLSQK